MADIKNDYATNLTSCWLSDDSTITTDLHGSNTLTDNNTVGTGTGKNGNAGDFENSNSEYLSLASTGLATHNDFTLMMWVNFESQPSGTNYALFTQLENTQRSLWIQYADHPSEKIRFITDADGSAGSATQADWNQTLSNSTWYHLAFVYDSAVPDVELFVNGSSISVETSSAIHNGTSDYRIGGDTFQSQYMDGLIHQVLFYTDKKDSTFIGNVYNSGDGVYYEAPPSTFVPRSSTFF